MTFEQSFGGCVWTEQECKTILGPKGHAMWEKGKHPRCCREKNLSGPGGNWSLTVSLEDKLTRVLNTTSRNMESEMSARMGSQRFLIRKLYALQFGFEWKTRASLWEMNSSKELDNGYTPDGTECGAADIRAWLSTFMKLDYCDFGSPETKKNVVLSINDGKQEMEEYLQSWEDVSANQHSDWGDTTKDLMSLLLQRLWQCLHTINFIINYKTKWAHGKVCDRASTANEGPFAFTDRDEIIYNNGVFQTKSVKIWQIGDLHFISIMKSAGCFHNQNRLARSHREERKTHFSPLLFYLFSFSFFYFGRQ